MRSPALASSLVDLPYEAAPRIMDAEVPSGRAKVRVTSDGLLSRTVNPPLLPCYGGQRRSVRGRLPPSPPALPDQIGQGTVRKLQAIREGPKHQDRRGDLGVEHGHRNVRLMPARQYQAPDVAEIDDPQPPGGDRERGKKTDEGEHSKDLSPGHLPGGDPHVANCQNQHQVHAEVA